LSELDAVSADEAVTLITPIETSQEHCDIPDFSALYQTWFPAVYRWIRALGGTGVDAEDLAQEVFIVVQRQLGRFDGRNLAGWLYRIAQLTVRDHRRHAWFRNIFQRSRDVTLEDLESPFGGPDDQLARKQSESCLYRLVNRLNEKWRDSFLLFEVAGLTAEEIATLQGIPPATVRTHLARARKEVVALVARLQARGEL
jgi:RNA polymerase sigma-70 factor, ECF subfamily